MKHRIHLFLMIISIPILVNLLHPFSEAQGEEIVITAVGDIMLAGSGGKTFSRKGYDYAFAATTGLLSSGDIAIGNLETPLSSRGTEFAGKRFRFRAPPEVARALKKAGFNVLTLANNHILDYGPAALSDTIHHLEREGIQHTGAGRDLAEARKEALLEVKGKKFAFLSYSLTLPAEFFASPERPGTAPGYLSFVIKDIERVRESSDYVIVSFHWGKENRAFPNALQVETAHKAVDAGADIIIGHHPHVLQGVERYRDGIIFYSLGNFAFGSMSAGSRSSCIARIKVDDGIKEVEVLPLNVLNKEVHFQPQFLSGKSGDELADRLNRLSGRWKTKVVKVADRYVVEFGDTVGVR